MWERVTINRATQSMTCENLGANADGSEALVECHNYAASGDKTVDMFDVY